MNFQHLPPLLLVLALHAAALAFAIAPKAQVQPQSIEPPILSGILLPAPELTKPMQTPTEQPRKKPVDKPVEKPKVTPKPPPLPKGPASERAVQAPKPETAPAKAETTSVDQQVQAKPSEVTPQLQLPSIDAAGIHNQAPVYPKLSRKRKEQGTVLLLLLVNHDGQVADIKIRHSSGFDRLDQAAVQAVKKWQFTPAKQDGKAIDYWYEMPINFSLNQPN